MDLTELHSADSYCRNLARRHYENFAVASFILSADIRLHLARIYAFCRTTDDFGDESSLGDESGRRGPTVFQQKAENAKAIGIRRLQRWRDEVENLFSPQATPVHPVLLAMKQTIDAFSIPSRPFLDLVQANIQDQTVSEYESWEELRAYCMLSAAPVGRMVLAVFGVVDQFAEALSDDVCIGLQIANHAQDVRRDALKGRTYLPQQDLRTEGVEGAVRHLCDRAQSLLEAGRSLETKVPLPLRVQLALYRLGGQEVVRSIRQVGYRTDEFRPRITSIKKTGLLSRAILESVTRMGNATPQRAA